MRSPTAETIFCEKDGFDVLSAGLNNDAEIPLTSQLVEWAKTIFVMEQTQRSKLQKKFRKSLKKQRIICLEIPVDRSVLPRKPYREIQSLCQVLPRFSAPLIAS